MKDKSSDEIKKKLHNDFRNEAEPKSRSRHVFRGRLAVVTGKATKLKSLFRQCDRNIDAVIHP